MMMLLIQDSESVPVHHDHCLITHLRHGRTERVCAPRCTPYSDAEWSGMLKNRTGTARWASLARGNDHEQGASLWNLGAGGWFDGASPGGAGDDRRRGCSRSAAHP